MRTWLSLKQCTDGNVSWASCDLSRPRDVPGGGDISKVALNDPCVPVVLERGQSGVTILHLPKCPLVDDGGVACVVEQAGGDPWLRQK